MEILQIRSVGAVNARIKLWQIQRSIVININKFENEFASCSLDLLDFALRTKDDTIEENNSICVH